MAATEVTTALPDPTSFAYVSNVLDTDQLARVAALSAARSALVNKAGVFGGSGAADPIDLVNVARYIETGIDPWTDVTGETVSTMGGDS